MRCLASLPNGSESWGAMWNIFQRYPIKSLRNYFFVEGDSYKDQIRQVVQHFSIDPSAMFLTRCLLCNRFLADTDKGLVENKVPQYVYETQDLFKICPACNKIFWHATHKERMISQLKAILT